MIPDGVVYGRDTQLTVGGRRLRGELLAVSADSVWLYTPLGVQAFALAETRDMRIRRHGLNAGKVFMWNAIGATVTGLVMTAACSSVEGASCGGVFPGIVLGWTIFGGLTGWALARSSEYRFRAPSSQMRGYARFPQGMPDGFERGAPGAPAADPVGVPRPPT